MVRFKSVFTAKHHGAENMFSSTTSTRLYSPHAETILQTISPFFKLFSPVQLYWVLRYYFLEQFENKKSCHFVHFDSFPKSLLSSHKSHLRIGRTELRDRHKCRHFNVTMAELAGVPGGPKEVGSIQKEHYGPSCERFSWAPDKSQHLQRSHDQKSL